MGVALRPGRQELVVEFQIEIKPIGIVLGYQVFFPGTLPLLDALFALQSYPNVLMGFQVDQLMEIVIVGETFNNTVSVLPNSTSDIVGHAHIENCVHLVGQYVDVILLHGRHYIDLIVPDKQSAIRDLEARCGG